MSGLEPQTKRMPDHTRYGWMEGSAEDEAFGTHEADFMANHLGALRDLHRPPPCSRLWPC
jgi:hypothetical protein